MNHVIHKTWAQNSQYYLVTKSHTAGGRGQPIHQLQAQSSVSTVILKWWAWSSSERVGPLTTISAIACIHHYPCSHYLNSTVGPCQNLSFTTTTLLPVSHPGTLAGCPQTLWTMTFLCFQSSPISNNWSPLNIAPGYRTPRYGEWQSILLLQC
jgi:hypothetical protein